MSKIVLDSIALYKLASETINISNDVTLTPLSVDTLSVSYPYKTPSYTDQNHGSNVIVNTESDKPEVYMAYTISGATISDDGSVVQYTPDGGDATNLTVSSVFSELTSLFTFSEAPNSSLTVPPTNLSTHFVVYGDSSDDFIGINAGSETTVLFMMNIDQFEINATQLWLHESNQLSSTNVEHNVQVINSERSTNNNQNASLPDFEWRIGENGLNGSSGDTVYDQILAREFTLQFKDSKSTSALNQNNLSGLQINTSADANSNLLVHIKQENLPNHLKIKPNNGNLGEYYSITSEIDKTIENYKSMRERITGKLTNNGLTITITGLATTGPIATFSTAGVPTDATLNNNVTDTSGAIFQLVDGVPSTLVKGGNEYTVGDQITVNDVVVTVDTIVPGSIATFDVEGSDDSLSEGDQLTLGDGDHAVTFEINGLGLPEAIINQGSGFSTYDNTQVQQTLDISLSNSLSFDIDRARLRIMDQFDEEVLSSNLSSLHQSIESTLATSSAANVVVTSSSEGDNTSSDTIITELNKIQCYYNSIRTHNESDDVDRKDTDSIQSLFRALQAFGADPLVIQRFTDEIDLSKSSVTTEVNKMVADVEKYKKQMATLLSLAKSQRHMSKRLGDENANQFKKLSEDVNIFLRSTIHQLEGDIVRKQYVVQQIIHDITRLQRKLNFSSSQYKQSADNMNNLFNSLVDSQQS